MSQRPGSYCINCGEKLSAEHRFCWACGTPRWEPEPEHRRDHVPTAPPSGPAPAAIPWLAWLFAGGAVLWLISLAQTAGVLAASPTRRQLLDQLAKAGYHGQTAVTIAIIEGAGLILVGLVVAALHGVAFYGLRDRKRWGWIAAVLVAGAWSLVCVGIPVLAILLRPSTRRAYGVT